jgi:predicted transcriptional regulator
MTSETASLISIRPRFVDAMFRGEKWIELRRRQLHVSAGHLLFVYETAPVMAIRGIVEVTRVVNQPLADLWALVAPGACVTRSEYETYFAGQSRASAIYLASPRAFGSALTLSTIRAASPLFHPPRTWTSFAALPLPLQVQLRALVGGDAEAPSGARSRTNTRRRPAARRAIGRGG